MPAVPKVNAFLICDAIIQEAGTNKKSLIGVFHNIHSPSFPCTHFSMSIYANVSDAQGEYAFDLKLVDLQTLAQIGRATLPPVNITDRLRPAELCISLRGITFPQAGKYEYQLYGNGDLVAAKVLEVLEAKPPQGPAQA